MVIDLSRMSYSVVDVANRRAFVGAGTNFGHLNSTLDSYDMHVPGGICEDICVAGYMQGGGYGFTSREFGMNCDNVLEINVMLHDGKIVVANEKQSDDLFWAIRGGTGNNFGVLLQITYELHQVGQFWGFGISWPIHDAAKALHELQTNFMKTGEPKIGYMVVLASQSNEWTLQVRGLYDGSEVEGMRAISSLLGTDGAKLVLNHPGTFHKLNRDLVRGFELPPTLAREDKQSAYISRMLTIQEWEDILELFQSKTPNRWSMLFIEPYGGRINQIPRDSNAFIHRAADMDLYVDVFWTREPEMNQAKQFLEEFMKIVDTRFSNGQSYQNYPRGSQKDYRRRYWDDMYNRLLKIKSKYDPNSFFHFEQSIS
jgi:FAD/FMN-containing dehydrogenase